MRTSISLPDEYWQKLETTSKKLKFSSRNELIQKILIDFIESDGKLRPENSKQKDEELKQLKTVDLKLKIWEKLKNAGYTLDQLHEILEGNDLPHPENKTFYPIKDEDEKPQLTFGKTIVHPKPETESDGLDENNFCSTCKHTHADTDPKVCIDLYCNCGIRG